MKLDFPSRYAFPELLATLILAAACVGQTGLDAQGKAVNPVRASGGKVAVLVFVRTDCPISNRYAPAIQKMAADYVGRAVFWLVYPDKSISAEEVRTYEQTYGYRLPGLRDQQHALVKAADVEITPEAAVFDASGKLVYHGRIDNWYEAFGRARPSPTTHELKDAIEAAQAGRKPAIVSAPAVGCYISDLR